MADLYSNNNDGRVDSSITTWAGARDDTSGSTPITDGTSTTLFTSVSKFSGRGGGSTFRVHRSFMYFDTSGITSTVSAATIKIYGVSGHNDGSIIAVKSTAFGGDGGTALAAGDIDAITGWTTGASAAGNVTDYSGAITTSSWSTSGYNSLLSTSDLRADMQNNNVVIICFMDYTNDYLNSEPSSTATLNVGGYYTDQSSTSKDPYIEYTVATGYANTVNGVASANIGKIMGVATADIEKVNGI